MTYVRYIDKTREYYLAQGYDNPYVWAQFATAPFTGLSKPLSDCRATLVTTSDLAVRGDGGSVDHKQEMFVGSAYVVPSDTALDRFYSRQDHYDKYATHLRDVDSYFPISRLREAVASGRLGSISAEVHGVHTSYSQRRTSERDAPAVLERCRADDVDIAILTPI